MAKKLDFKTMAVKTAGLVAGGVGASMVDKFIPASLDSKLVNGGKIVIGAVLSHIGKGGILSGVGDGMTAVGGANLAASLMPTAVSGVGAANDFYASIRGAELPASIAGTDTDLGE